jgi:hypothetical protein
MRDRVRDAGCDLDERLQLASGDDETAQLGDGSDAQAGAVGIVRAVADRPSGPDDRDGTMIAVLQERLAVGDDDRFLGGLARCGRSRG